MPQNTAQYMCNGVTIPGNAPIGLLPGSITPAEDGGKTPPIASWIVDIKYAALVYGEWVLSQFGRICYLISQINFYKMVWL